MKKLLVAAVLFASHCVMAQDGAFEYFNTSRFARAMRLGNAYTGVAEGPETMFYNAAGLADVKSYSALASTGQGLMLTRPESEAADMAITIPVSNAGTAGASINYLTHKLWFENDVVYRIYSLSYAHKIITSLSLGLTVNLYHLSLEGQFTVGNPPTTANGTALDINFGLLYKLPVQIFQEDALKIGFQAKNLLAQKLSYDLIPHREEKLFQEMRMGVSYSIVPDLKSIAGFTPVKFMAAFDAIFMGADYSFVEWQPNYGLELTLMEMFQVSFGRENEEQLKETYFSSFQYPVNGYGVGLIVPLNKLFDLNFPFDLRIDYCKSDWKNIDEENGKFYLGESGTLYDLNVQDEAVSVGVDVRI